MDFTNVLNPADLIAVWPGTPREAIRLYDLMCETVNGERSDFPTGYGEPSHVEHMTNQRESECV